MLLNDYLPPYLTKTKIFNTLLTIKQSEIDSVNYSIKDILNQCFVNTATWGLYLWEQFLGLPTHVSISNEIRRSRILARLRGVGTFTESAVIGLGNAFDSEMTTEFVSYFKEYVFSTRNKAIAIVDFEGFMEAFTEMKPAHMRHIPILYTVVLGQKFRRYTVLNYLASITRTGVLRGKRSIHSKRKTDLYLSTQQIALDGARILDSGWALNGSEVEQPIKYSLGLKVEVAISKSAANSRLSNIASTRTATINPDSSVLNGAWLLDAGRNMGGLGSIRVKVNGIAV